jgi:hypothetical protein
MSENSEPLCDHYWHADEYGVTECLLCGEIKRVEKRKHKGVKIEEQDEQDDPNVGSSRRKG